MAAMAPLLTAGVCFIAFSRVSYETISCFTCGDLEILVMIHSHRGAFLEVGPFCRFVFFQTSEMILKKKRKARGERFRTRRRRTIKERGRPLVEEKRGLILELTRKIVFFCVESSWPKARLDDERSKKDSPLHRGRVTIGL